jgi:hypothetical protein
LTGLVSAYLALIQVVLLSRLPFLERLAAFAMGEAGIHWTARLRDHEAMTILADRRVLSTPGFPS